MSVTKVTVSLDAKVLRKVDRLVRLKKFPSRSRAVQTAIEEKLARFDKSRLALECEKLDPLFEQALADEGLSLEHDQWPAY